jgi:CheY-like chemotaxis protein
MADIVPTKAHILLVDDDSFLLDMYALKFKNAGYEVTAISDPQEAVDKLKGGDLKPNIILFDIVMPGIGGWGFAEQVRAQELATDATMIVLSNQGQQMDFDISKKYNVDGYIVKALSTPTEVLQKVETIYNK